MDQEMNTVKNILDYWYNLEFFSPFWPEKTRDTIFININSVSNRVPWEKESSSKYTYNVYLGKKLNRMI